MAKDVLTSSTFGWAGSSYGITAVDYNPAHNEIDTTDTSTSGDTKEYTGGRVERPFSVTIISDSANAMLTLNSEQTATLDFEGLSYTGLAKLLNGSITGSIDSRIEITYNGRFTGTVTEATS